MLSPIQLILARAPTTLPALILAAGLAPFLLNACFPQNGMRYTPDRATLLEDARHACQRRDHDAYRTLLARIIETYPDTDEAFLAERELARPTPPTRCP